MTASRLRATPPKEIRRLSVRSLHELRAAIPAGQIVSRLGRFATGAWETVRVPSERAGEVLMVERPIEMNANQVRAAIALLNKVMPDLQSVAMELNVNAMDELTTDQLRARFRAIVAESEVIDVPATSVSEDLLSLDGVTSVNDLLDLG